MDSDCFNFNYNEAKCLVIFYKDHKIQHPMNITPYLFAFEVADDKLFPVALTQFGEVIIALTFS